MGKQEQKMTSLNKTKVFSMHIENYFPKNSQCKRLHNFGAKEKFQFNQCIVWALSATPYSVATADGSTC